LKDVQNVQSEGLSQVASAMQIDESLETVNHISSEQDSEARKRKSEEDERHLEGFPSAKRSKGLFE